MEVLPHDPAQGYLPDSYEKGQDARVEQPKTEPVFDARKMRIVRLKTDLCVIPFIFFMYLWSSIDRINIGNARIYGLEAELGMTGFNFNTTLSVYFIAYTVFEIPMTILCKAVGPGWWIPGCTLVFGIISLCTAYVHTFGQITAVRFLLGISEAAILPSCIYALTRWYSKTELVYRVGILVSGGLWGGAFGGLIAYGVVKNLTSIAGVHTWRMLFLLEGIITIAVGAISLVGYTNSIDSARFLTAEEKDMRKAYLAYHDAVAEHSVDDRLKSKIIKQGLLNINANLIGLILLLNSIIFQGIVVFLPTIIAGLYPNDQPIIKNLRSVPPYFAAIVVMYIVTYASSKMGGYRGFWGLCFLAPMHIIGYALFLGGQNPATRYAGAFFILPATNVAAFGQAWIAANVAPDAARAAGISMVTCYQNVGGLISTWTYLPTAAPQYTAGNSVNLAIGVCITLLFGITLLYQRHENRIRDSGGRDHRLEGKTESEIAQLGHLHPSFRYSY